MYGVVGTGVLLVPLGSTFQWGGTLLDYTEGSKGSVMAVDGLQWFHRGEGVRLGFCSCNAMQEGSCLPNAWKFFMCQANRRTMGDHRFTFSRDNSV